MNELEKYSEKNENIETTVWIALSYGGRAEIIEATNRAIRNGKEVTEETFAQLLWTADMPDPDIIVRTGGEKRLSNFMTWRSVYSELLFIDTYWPALTKVEFNGILKEYESRERRGGK
jgi:undecaprenyl diphosphate synthase